jgi:hypothetical protein
MIGGTAYAAGRNAANNRAREEDQQARIDALEQQQYAQQQYAQPAPPPAAAAPATDIASRLSQLKGLLDSGALTQAEFDSAKAQILAGG